MTTEERNVRVSFKLSQEAAIKLREMALSKGDLLCKLGVLAVQLGNESQICISSPLNFNFSDKASRERPSDDGFDSELTDSVGDLSGNEKISEEESVSDVDRGVREVEQAVALATAASVKLSDDESKSEPNNASLSDRTHCIGMSAKNAVHQETRLKKKKNGSNRVNNEHSSSILGSLKVTAPDLTAENDPDLHVLDVNDSVRKFDGSSGVSFAQQLINLSKQYRLENDRSPNDEKYFANDASTIVRRDHILRCFNDKPEDLMGLNVNNALLFDSYETTVVKSAEELSKEQSEMSPTNMDSMSVSSADSLFEEARLGSVDELRLSPSSITVSAHNSSHSGSPSPSESTHSEYSPSKEEKLKRSVKYQKLLKGQTGVVCELCMHPVQKSYSCYQMNHAPKEIKHLFDGGSRCVRVCRRCLPYKSPKGHDRHGHKKAKRMVDQLS